MGWFLWGIAFSWAGCTAFHYSQRDEDAETTSNGALIVFGVLLLIALVVSVALSLQPGAIPTPTPTPTSLGR